jgi:hypothetical protein
MVEGEWVGGHWSLGCLTGKAYVRSGMFGRASIANERAAGWGGWVVFVGICDTSIIFNTNTGNF